MDRCASFPEGLRDVTSGLDRKRLSLGEGAGLLGGVAKQSQSADSGFQEAYLATPEASMEGITTPESSTVALTTLESLGLTTPESPGLTTPESPGLTTPESLGLTTPESLGLTTPESPGITTLESLGLTTPESSEQRLTTPESNVAGLTTPESPVVALTTLESSLEGITTPESIHVGLTTVEPWTIGFTTPGASRVRPTTLLELTTPESSIAEVTTPEASRARPTTQLGLTTSGSPERRITTPESNMAVFTTPEASRVPPTTLLEPTTLESPSAILTTPESSSSSELTPPEASSASAATPESPRSLLGLVFRRLTSGQAAAAKPVSRVQFAVPEAEPEVASTTEAPRTPDVASEPPASSEATPPAAPVATPPSSPAMATPPPRESEEERGWRVGGFWPHAPSSLFATLTCTVGMFDLCRFSYLSFQYGGGFILQFLMLTIVFGLPMLSFQMSAGQYLGAGIMDMWKVSPIFYGVGVSSVVSMALYGVYNVIPVSWMFVYFRDSFVTNLTFKWGECRNVYRPEECQKYSSLNTSDILERSIPAYFQNRVLQRNSPGNTTSSANDLVFENVFNLAVIWMVIFICLSKGIKSYGKVVLAFGIFPMLSFYLLSIELLRRASSGAELIMSLHTDMSGFFLNGWSWLAAAREVFFIWGMNGAAIMQIASHNKHRHNLKRDCAIVIVITLSIVLLSAFLTCACIYIIYKYDRFQHRFVPSSFETANTARFLLPNHQFEQLDIDMGNFVSTNYLVGVESVARNGDTTRTSGHQVARFATELYPTALVTLTPSRVSAFWPVLFYLCLITFGVAQQLAVWKCVVEGVIAIYPEKLRSWETSITFLACVFGFVLGLPFVTQVGVYVVHFMDVCVGSAWWIMLIYLVQVFALLLVRGRPYTSDDIVLVLTNTPVMKRWLAPVIGFSWNVVLPITLLVLSITSFKLGDFGRLFFWDSGQSYAYWPLWAKQIGAFVQILPIVVIPSVSLIQIMRYMSKSSGGFMERFEHLVRPPPPLLPSIPEGGASAQATPQSEPEATASQDDPPPKYTPPPSYNTATGMKLLKRLNSLRMSFRRSQRSRRSRVSGDVEMQRTGSTADQQAADTTTTATTTTTAEVTSDVPPRYSAVTDQGSAADQAT